MRYARNSPSIALLSLKTVAQAGLLVVLCSLILALLRIHDSRAAVRYAAELALQDSDGSLAIGPTMNRETAQHLSAREFSAWPCRTPGDDLQRHFRVGETHRSLIKGALIARPTHPVRERSRTIAFVFEMQVSHVIEQAEAGRIVEVRYFDWVRRAKIVTTASPLRIDLGPPGTRLLRDLPFADPNSGIVVAPVRATAEAILAKGARRVAADASSRAYLEQDVLSGRWVRMAHADGVGVEWIEPLRWRPTITQSAELFARPLAAPTAMLQPNDPSKRGRPGPLALIAQFVDPSMSLLYEDEKMRFLRAEPEDQRHQVYRIRRLAEDRAPASDKQGQLQGNLRYDRERGIIGSAELSIPMELLMPARDGLLFEQSFEGAPSLQISYYGDLR